MPLFDNKCTGNRRKDEVSLGVTEHCAQTEEGAVLLAISINARLAQLDGPCPSRPCRAVVMSLCSVFMAEKLITLAVNNPFLTIWVMKFSEHLRPFCVGWL